MPSVGFSLAGLFVVAFGCAAWLEPWFHQHVNQGGAAPNVLAVLMGDSRRLFAQHFFAKADAYFHGGYYPSIFDVRPQSGQLHLAANAGAGHEGEEGFAIAGKPRDWLERFGRHFQPFEHRHLGGDDEAHHDDHADHDHSVAAHGTPGEERELLPWLRVATELDPHRAESYVVASYWLRSRLGKVDEAEQFLRDGLRHNPGDSEILFELGRIYRENRQDNARARNVWELSLAAWRKTEAPNAEPNLLLGAQLLGNLAKLEEAEHQYSRARHYLEELEALSPNKESLRTWMDELKARSNAERGQPEG